MELHELGVADPGAGVDREAERVARVLVTPRRAVAPDPGMAAGREDDGVGVDDVARAVFQVEAVGAEDHPVSMQEPRDVHGVEDRDLQLGGAADEGSLDLEAGEVTGECRATVRVSSEEPLRDAPVRLAGERHPEALEVGDAPRRSFGDGSHGARVGQQVALLERVGRVLLPGVVRVHRGERGVDAAGGERRVRVSGGPFPDGEHIHPPLGELDRGAQT